MPRPHNPCQKMGGAARAPPLTAFPAVSWAAGPPGRQAEWAVGQHQHTPCLLPRRRHALADILLAKLTQLGGQHKLGAAGLPAASGVGLQAQLAAEL